MRARLCMHMSCHQKKQKLYQQIKQPMPDPKQKSRLLMTKAAVLVLVFVHFK